MPERRQWRRSGIFIVNFEHISHLVLVFLLLTLSRQMPAGIADTTCVWRIVENAEISQSYAKHF